MAFNWQTFQTRTITAIIFAAVMLVGLLSDHWAFLILFSIIHFGCWWEYLKLIEKITTSRFHNYTKFGLMMIGYGLVLWFCSDAFQVNGYNLQKNLSLPVSAAGLALLVIGVFQKNKINIRSILASLFGLIYISLCFGLLVDLRGSWIFYEPAKDIWVDNMYLIPVFVIVSLWINDTMAYIVGSLIGKTPISKISPKKTWEGTIGGILLCIATMGTIAYAHGYWKGPISPQQVLIIASITAIVATFGDLFESKLKRMAGVKDSGRILPGHGGFLDRFDSLLFAVPFVWLYVYFFMR